MDWKHALDLQHDTCKYYRSDDGIALGSEFLMSLFQTEPKPSVETLGGMYLDMLACLYQADTIFVTSDMLHLAMQAGHDMPENARFDIRSLLSRRGFVLLEEGIKGEDKHGATYVVSAFAWEKTLISDPRWQEGSPPQEAISLYFFTDPYDAEDDWNEAMREALLANEFKIPPLALTHYFPLVDGYHVRPRYEQGFAIVTELLRLFMALMYLSHQTIGEPIKLRPDRAARKRAQREWNQNDPLITVITLRRKSVKKDPEDEPGKVEWSRRWLVRGFWRKQWYPSLGIHQPVYIHEYIKGPEDKPFIPPSGRVFNFRR